MTRWKISGAALLTSLLLLTGHARAFGPEGHAIIAEIAEARLTDKAKEQIAALLKLDDSHAKHLDQIASWPDAIRPSRPETGNWHFVDIPLDAPKYVASRDCKEGDCVVVAIKRFADVLGTKDAEPKDRLEALKFLVHFVGDIHQPLHCVTDFSKFPPPEGDRGGNKIHLTYFGKPMNFHSLWDGGIIEEALDLELGPHFAPNLKGTFAEAMKLNKKIRDNDAAAWAPDGLAGQLDTVVVDWANDTHVLAQNAYRNLPTPRLKGWDETYKDFAWPVIEAQLMRGGVRLAKILNEKLR